MKTARSVHAALLATVALGLLSECGAGAQQTPGPTLSTAVMPVPREPAPDLSEVPMPESVLVVVRVSPLPQFAERAGQLTGLGTPFREQVEAVFNSFGHALASVIERSAPVDVLVVAPTESDRGPVLSFATLPLDEVERVLGRDHRLLPMGNGARRIEAMPATGLSDLNTQDQGEPHDDESGLRRSACVIAPSPTAGQGRLLCAESLSHLEGVIAFASRTLPRREVAPDSIALDVQMDSLRSRYLQSAIQELDDDRVRIDSRIGASSTGALNEPTARAALATLAHEILDAIHSLIADPTRGGSTFTLRDNGAALHIAADLRRPSSSIVRAVAEGTRDQPAIAPDLFSHLLPDGWLYSTMSADARPFASTFAQLATLGNLLAQHDASLNAADRTALTAALQGLTQLDQSSLAIAVGNEATGQPWITATARHDTLSGSHVVAAYRSIVLALRRPNIFRSLRTTLHVLGITMPDLGELRELPSRGLPAGAFGFRVPSVQSIMASGAAVSATNASSIANASALDAQRRRTRAVRPASNSAADVGLQVLLVPDGHNVTLAVGADARVLYTRYRANRTPGIDAGYITGANRTASLALVAAGVPNLIRMTSPGDVGAATTFVAQLTDHGRTPITLQLFSTGADDAARFALDLDVPRTILRGLADSTMQRATAAANPCAGGNPCGVP